MPLSLLSPSPRRQGLFSINPQYLPEQLSEVFCALRIAERFICGKSHLLCQVKVCTKAEIGRKGKQTNRTARPGAYSDFRKYSKFEMWGYNPWSSAERMIWARRASLCVASSVFP